MNSRLFYALVRRNSFHSMKCYHTKHISNKRLDSLRYISSKVPKEPTWKSVDPKDLPKETVVDAKMVEHLERLALVDFNNQAGIDRLNAAIRFADQLHLVDTTGVKPMDSVLEDRELYLREDQVTQGNCKNDILSNAAKTEEDYFVAPPGNIPLKQTEKSYRDGES